MLSWMDTCDPSRNRSLSRFFRWAASTLLGSQVSAAISDRCGSDGPARESLLASWVTPPNEPKSASSADNPPYSSPPMAPNEPKPARSAGNEAGSDRMHDDPGEGLDAGIRRTNPPTRDGQSGRGRSNPISSGYRLELRNEPILHRILTMTPSVAIARAESPDRRGRRTKPPWRTHAAGFRRRDRRGGPAILPAV
jgi:hypothetical protein